MNRRGYGTVLTTLLLSLLLQLAECQAKLNDSTLQLELRHPTLNATNVWSLPLPPMAVVPLQPAKEQLVEEADGSYAAHLARSSIIYGLAEVANASNVNAVCHAQLKHLQRGVLGKQPWAMKVLDASGSKSSGFVFGQNYWFGSRDACRAVQQPVGITLSKQFERVMHYGLVSQLAPFAMDYRVVYLSHRSPWQVEIKLMTEQVLHIGLCLPSSCQSAEIKSLTSDYLESSSMDNNIFELNTEVLYMKDLQLSNAFYERLSFKLLVGFLLATCAFMLCAQQLKVAKKLPPEADDAAAGLAPVESEMWRALHGLLKWQPLQSFVSCYDVSSNWSKIWSVRATSSNEIPLVNGVRSVCALWLVVFHVFWFMYFTINNKVEFIAYAEHFFFQFISSSPILVDVFFTLSGFLQAYNFMRNTKQMDAVRQNGLRANAKLYGKLLFHRYLRFGPLYLIVICSVDLAFAYMGDTSVYHIPDRFDQICSQHWWRNVLYIQNFFDHSDMCLNWSWSLACDMQYFVLANVILFLYAKRPKLAKLVTFSALLASIIWSLGVGIHHNLEFSFDSFYSTANLIYTSSFVRVIPYIVGGIAAGCLHEGLLQFELSDLQERSLWHFSLFVFMACIYSTLKRDMGYLISISMFVFGRVLFSLSVCWMITSSARGRGVWWSRLLEAPIFQHISRLTYAIYLLNPLVISLVYSLTTASSQVDSFLMFVVSCGFMMVVYVTSLVYSMIFEMPYSNLSSLLLRRIYNSDSKPKTM